LGEAGRPVKAEAQFREVLRLESDELEARLNLAVTLMLQKRLPEAIAEYEEILQYDPTSTVALHNLPLFRKKPVIEPLK
jgi:Flp pilus assembly protein TadD